MNLPLPQIRQPHFSRSRESSDVRRIWRRFAEHPWRMPADSPETREMRGSVATFLTGAGFGAVLAYLFDPERGRRHRALMRDKMIHLYHAAPDVADTLNKDLSNRARGALAEMRATLHQEPVPDEILGERVRARLGRFVSHPGSIEVTALDGLVMLRGLILRHEVGPLLSGIAGIRGVEDVQSDLEVHDRPDHISGLQGGVSRPGRQVEWLQENWSPSARLTALLGGTGLCAAGARMRGVPGLIVTIAGGALVVRGLVNLPFRRLLGIDDSPRTVNMHKTIHVKGPIEEVFRLWTDFEDYPRFMEHVHEVRDLGDGQLHWRVMGPAGSTVEWDAEISELIPNEVVTWHTAPGAVVRQAGHTRFTEEPDGTTRIDVHLSYSPPAGILGHLAATAFGVDPKRSMEDDLVRFQSLFEPGKTTAHGTTVTRDELQQEIEV